MISSVQFFHYLSLKIVSLSFFFHFNVFLWNRLSFSLLNELDFAKTWASALQGPDLFPAETVGIDISGPALQFGKTAELFG